MAVKIYLYDNEYDCVGSGTLGAEFVQYQLQAAAGDDIDVHISSCGGDAFAAVTIYGLLKKYTGKVTTYIDSIAASAAATIAMAGEVVIMSKYALLMIHKPITYSGGNADDLTGDVAMLEAIQKNIVAIYMDKTGLPQEKVEELVNATTWLTADEALEYNFINQIEDYAPEGPIVPVRNASVVTNYVKTAPKKYAEVINKILINEPAPATNDKPMTEEERAEIVNPLKALLSKVKNYLHIGTNKLVSNNGEMFFVGNISQGTNVFADNDLETAANDGDMEVEDSVGNKTVYTIAAGKVSNIVVTNKAKNDELEDDCDDEDMEPENLVVMNRIGVNMKKKAGNKAVKNGMAVKLIEVTNKLSASEALVLEMRGQLEVANAGLAKSKEDIKNEILTEFVPNASNRHSRPGAVNTAVPDFLKPKPGSTAENAAKMAVAGKK